MKSEAYHGVEVGSPLCPVDGVLDAVTHVAGSVQQALHTTPPTCRHDRSVAMHIALRHAACVV